jgi:site-specific DNA-methyltransferase (adenine-specific)
MTRAIIIGADPSRSRSPRGERRSPTAEARNHARTAFPAGQVVHGDCIERMRAMPSRSVDFILTDPPYITRYRERGGRSVANDDNADWLRPAFAEMYRVLTQRSFCVSFYGWHKADLFIAAWRAAGFRLVGHIVFRKRYASSVRFLRCEHEAAYLPAKGEVTPPASPVADVLDWTYTGNRLHPTQKPISVLKPLIEAFCKPGGVVLDPFCGSGSTLVAAAGSRPRLFRHRTRWRVSPRGVGAAESPQSRAPGSVSSGGAFGDRVWRVRFLTRARQPAGTRGRRCSPA